MFENCSTLVELNKARSELVKAGADKMQINSAYNAARTRILREQVSFNKIPMATVEDVPTKVFCAFPICGFSDDSSVLELTDKGFLI